MDTGKIIATTETVPVGSLTPHPKNARRGNVDAIAESLAAHGQYRPIVANSRTNRILAGSHTWRAAKSLGWPSIAVSWVDVDEKDEVRILLADNRASDLATYDDGALAALLADLGDLAASGYTADDLEALEGLWSEPSNPNTVPTAPEPLAADAEINLGPYRLTVDRYAFDEWAVPVEQAVLKPEDTIRRRLRIPLEPRPTKSDPELTPVKLSTVGSEAVPVEKLTPYPGNARQGDIGMISESLRVNGQFRPIVVNRPTGQILVGNHTYAAAVALGWSEVAVTFVDVDEDEARRIVLVDNRTADLGTYDDEQLTDLLSSLSRDLTGTGYTLDDLDELLLGASGRQSRPVSGAVTYTVDRWKLKIPASVAHDWQNELGSDPHSEIAFRLELTTWRPA
jgi:ParB-like chromosome segregation protein Spo0J